MKCLIHGFTMFLFNFMPSLWALCSTVVFEILEIQKGLEAYPCRFSMVPMKIRLTIVRSFGFKIPLAETTLDEFIHELYPPYMMAPQPLLVKLL